MIKTCVAIAQMADQRQPEVQIREVQMSKLIAASVRNKIALENVWPAKRSSQAQATSTARMETVIRP